MPIQIFGGAAFKLPILVEPKINQKLFKNVDVKLNRVGVNFGKNFVQNFFGASDFGNVFVETSIFFLQRERVEFFRDFVNFQDRLLDLSLFVFQLTLR